MTITLEAIKEQHAKVGEMIATFEKQTTTTVYAVAATSIQLAPGERYAGVALGVDGRPSHHLVLLPGQIDDATWQKALDWAAERSGDLPTRREQSLLFAHLKEEFDGIWYWSGEQYSSSSAWCQSFDDGSQLNYGKDLKLRARAVRRLSI